MFENLKAKGDLVIELRDADGNLKMQREEKNLVVTVGKGYITSRMKDASATAMSHIAVGTGAVAPAAGDTTLGTEIGTRVAGTVTQVTTTTANDTFQIVSTFPAGNGTGAITEAGIFNASTVGTLLSRTTFSAVNKAAGDSLTITWKIQLT